MVIYLCQALTDLGSVSPTELKRRLLRLVEVVTINMAYEPAQIEYVGAVIVFQLRMRRRREILTKHDADDWLLRSVARATLG